MLQGIPQGSAPGHVLTSVTAVSCHLLMTHSAEVELPYTYKFSRDVNFTDDSNLGFLQLIFIFVDHLLFTPCVSNVLRWFYEISRI